MTSARIPLVDLAAQYRAIRLEVRDAIDRVLESTQFVLGAEVSAFEAEFGAYCQAEHAVGVNSGTSALHLALLAAEVGPGDEVITTPFTFVATVASICQVGARPILVDVEPDTLNIDPRRLSDAVTPRTKAIVPVHLYGHPADMAPILAIAERHGLTVIEDAAQAHGAAYRGRPVGSMGQLACFSFYPGKNLGAYGEAGIVFARDARQANVMRALRDHGQVEQYQHRYRGFNYRLEAIQAAVLRVKLRYLEEWTERRRAHARAYDGRLAGASVETPTTRADVRHVYHQYVVRSDARDDLRRHLLERGIQTGIHYPVPVHLQEGFADLGYRPGDFPVAEASARRVLSLPVYPEMTPADLDAVVGAVHSFEQRVPKAVMVAAGAGARD